MVSSNAWIAFAILLMLLPLNWLAAAVLAAGIHELSHLAAILLCGGKVTAFRLSQTGACMEVGELSLWQELLCAAAGPMGSLLLTLHSKLLPLTGFCAFIQLLYNLLPVYPLDGGRILACLLRLLVPQYKKGIMSVAFWITAILISAISIWFTFRIEAGVLPMMAGGVLLLRLLPIKIPCKRSRFRVQ